MKEAGLQAQRNIGKGAEVQLMQCPLLNLTICQPSVNATAQLSSSLVKRCRDRRTPGAAVHGVFAGRVPNSQQVAGSLEPVAASNMGGPQHTGSTLPSELNHHTWPLPAARFMVTVYNPLAWQRIEPIRVPVVVPKTADSANGGGPQEEVACGQVVFRVSDAHGAPVPSAVLPVSEAVHALQDAHAAAGVLDAGEFDYYLAFYCFLGSLVTQTCSPSHL